jgi:hypothetical protein
MAAANSSFQSAAEAVNDDLYCVSESASVESEDLDLEREIKPKKKKVKPKLKRRKGNRKPFTAEEIKKHNDLWEETVARNAEKEELSRLEFQRAQNARIMDMDKADEEKQQRKDARKLKSYNERSSKLKMRVCEEINRVGYRLLHEPCQAHFTTEEEIKHGYESKRGGITGTIQPKGQSSMFNRMFLGCK